MPGPFQCWTLAETEAALVGACLDHETTLVLALDRLPPEPFRSDNASDLHKVYYALAALRHYGYYNPSTNRDSIAILESRLGTPERIEWTDFLDDLFCPAGGDPVFANALIGALLEAYSVQDRAVAALSDFYHRSPVRITGTFQDAIEANLRIVPAPRSIGLDI